MELKKPTTFTQQVKLLAKKNIIIPDEKACADFLSSVNYYRFSGYYLPFITKRSEHCRISVPFEQIQNIYYFDAELRSLLFMTIEQIEIYLRTQFAYFHAHTYGAEGYTTAQNFNSFHKHASFIQHINACITENENTLVVKHHTAYYDGHFPIWVIIEFFSMGMLSYFYRGMKNPDKSYLAQNLFGVNYQILESWLRCLTDLRNRCAHYSRIYYWKFPAMPRIPPHAPYVATRRLFAQLYMLKFLYPTPEKWNQNFYEPLTRLIENYNKYISLKHLDFPNNWEVLLKQ